MTTALGRSLIMAEAAQAAGRRTVFRFDDAVREGDPAGGIFLVLCGTLLGSMETPGGERIVATYAQGVVFGATPCLDGPGEASPGTVTAMRPSSVAFLPDEMVAQMIPAHPILGEALRAVLGRQHRDRIDVLASLLATTTVPSG